MALILVATLATACGENGSPQDANDAGRIPVVASFYPAFEAARRIGSDRISVTNLTPAGAEPHDLELSSRQVDQIEDARMVFYLGDDFQPGVEEAVQKAKGEAVDLLSPELGVVEGDPHFWLDPTLMRKAVQHMQSVLANTDPANAAAYRDAAQAYAAELDQLDQAFRDGLRDCDRRVIVTAHAAFGYLARQYGLVQEAVAGLSPESEPEPSRLSELAARVRREGITTIFYETLVSPKVAQALAREAGVATAVLNPIEGLTEDEARAGKTYLSLMRDNLVALRAALGCR